MNSSLSHTPYSPPIWARFVVFLAWAMAATIVFCCALMGPVLVGILPIVLAFGVGLITSAHSLLDEP